MQAVLGEVLCQSGGLMEQMDGTGHKNICRKSFSGPGAHSTCKGPEAEMCLERPRWAWLEWSRSARGVKERRSEGTHGAANRWVVL